MDAIRTALAACFWCCGSLIFYSYLGYPLVIWCLSREFGRDADAPDVPDEELPPVSLLIAAYNEEAVIEERIRDALRTDYPPDRFEIAVGSDGSEDRTAEIARRYADRGVRLFDYPQRRGKAAVLNSSIPELSGRVVILSDANTSTEPSAARRLVRWFRDPDVGAVCGRLVLTDPATGANADGLYWKYETFLKRCEGRLGALLGANGAIYAIRRDLYVPIPEGTIVDDLVIPLVAKLESGCAIVYDGRAIAREETAPDVKSEFRRRSRIGAGGFQSLAMLAPLLDPRRGWVALSFSSHKLLRWVCPFFLAGMGVSNMLLWDRPFYGHALAAQAAFYSTALVTSFIPSRSAALRPLRLTTLFVGMNAALLVGFWRWARGSQGGTWKPTTRPAGSGPAGVAR